MVDSMLKWIDRKDDQPFFAVGWTTQTHHPYQMAPGQTEQTFCDGKLPLEMPGLNQYLNCMAEDDRQIGRLIDGLKARGLDDDTLVVVTGDHGEAFGWPHDTVGHGFALYQECLNVPCLFWNPAHFPDRATAAHGRWTYRSESDDSGYPRRPRARFLAGAQPAGFRSPATRLLLRGQSRLPPRCARGQLEIHLQRQHRR